MKGSCAPPVSKHIEEIGHKENACHHQPDGRIQKANNRLLPQTLPSSCREPKQEIENDQQNLFLKEIVIIQGVQENGKDKQPRIPLFFRHQFFQSEQQKRKKGNHIHKGKKEQIHGLPPGEGVQHRSDHRRFLPSDKPLQIQVGETACRCILEHHHGRHEIRVKRSGKRQCQPVERTAQVVITETVENGTAQIHSPVPLSAEDRADLSLRERMQETRQLHTERDLLLVKIGKHQKSATALYHKQRKRACPKEQTQQKDTDSICFFPFLSHLFSPPGHISFALINPQSVQFRDAKQEIRMFL